MGTIIVIASASTPVPVLVVNTPLPYTQGTTEKKPVYTKAVTVAIDDPVALATRDLVNSTDKLFIATLLLFIAAVAVPIVTGCIERNRRKSDREHEKKLRLEDAAEAMRDQAMIDEYARRQLVSILRIFEQNVRLLIHMPRMPIATAATMLLPLLERALQPDMARSMDRDIAERVYGALALAQQQMGIAGDQQAFIDRERAQLESERIEATAYAREKKSADEDLAHFTKQLSIMVDPPEKARIRDAREGAQQRVKDLESSERHLRMAEFSESQEQRRKDIQSIVPLISENMTSVRKHLVDARHALGDDEAVSDLISEGKLSDVNFTK